MKGDREEISRKARKEREEGRVKSEEKISREERRGREEE